MTICPAGAAAERHAGRDHRQPRRAHHLHDPNGPGNPTDWVGLYNTNTVSNGGYLGWVFLNGLQSPPSAGMTTATVQFTAPSTPGTYHARFFANFGYGLLATSAAITVVSAPTLRVNDVSVTEGHAGTRQATFTVTLAPANPTQAVTVNYATANGSATAGSDYGAVSGTLTFAPSVTTQTFTVNVLGDTAIEPTETFLVNLSGATNATVGDAQGVGTITNDDAPPPPTITPNVTTVSPGASITFTVENGPGNPTDWVGLYATGSGHGSYLSWKFLNGLQSAPSPGMTTATIQFTAPSTPGTYHARFFANYGYGLLATSATVTVAP